MMDVFHDDWIGELRRAWVRAAYEEARPERSFASAFDTALEMGRN